ncbi:MAG: hypothetical protein ACMXYG_07700, partial [Candidatus Woesearchaeota archaeon]
TSINYLVDPVTTSGVNLRNPVDLGEVFGSSLSNCKQGVSEPNNLLSCGNNLYFNPQKNTLIFSKQIISSPDSYNNILKRLFTNFMRALIDALSNQNDFRAYDYSILQRLAEDLYIQSELVFPLSNHIPDFECDGCIDNLQYICGNLGNPRKLLDLNTIYLSRIGQRSIFGMAEYETQNNHGDSSPSRVYGVMYQGFEGICDSFRPNVVGYNCIKKESNYYVAARITNPSLDISYDSLVDISSWEQFVFMAPSLRIQ